MTTNKIEITYKQYQHLKLILNDKLIKKPRRDGVVNVYNYKECQITIYRKSTTKKLGFVIQGNNSKVNAVKNHLCQTLSISHSANISPQTANTFQLASAKLEDNAPKVSDLTKNNYVGCDEVGVGDFFGPIVTCAVFLTVKNQDYLSKIQIQDSKKLTDSAILWLAKQIKKEIKYEITTIIPLAYNKLIEQGTNANAIKALSHNQSINTLFWDKKLPEETPIVMDQFAERKLYIKYLEQFQKKHHSSLKIIIPTIFATKAESLYPAVAAASILARATFLQWIERFSKKLKISLPLGANPAIVNSTAIEIAQKHGLKSLNKLVKIHFKNYRSVAKI